jgi:hypothetical protein
MDGKTIAYWLTTGLLALAMLGGGAADIAQPESIQQAITHLGYPAYVFTLLGVWKLLGAVTILAPKLPRLKEWAYAGFVFDLSGALVSHVAVGDGFADFAPVPVLLLITGASWWLRPEGRRL